MQRSPVRPARVITEADLDTFQEHLTERDQYLHSSSETINRELENTNKQHNVAMETHLMSILRQIQADIAPLKALQGKVATLENLVNGVSPAPSVMLETTEIRAPVLRLTFGSRQKKKY